MQLEGGDAELEAEYTHNFHIETLYVFDKNYVTLARTRDETKIASLYSYKQPLLFHLKYGAPHVHGLYGCATCIHWLL